MAFKNRTYSLSIWAFALGYFIFYIPYSALIKALTEGALPGMRGPVSGFELLPSTVIATAVGMTLFITLMGWWKHAGRRQIFGMSLPFPNRWTFISGIGFAAIIVTTTLAYTFDGVSILFALLLLRGGVLILAPIVDAAFKRRVRWFSWAALALSLAALGIAFSDVENYELPLIASLNVAVYLTGYMMRLPCMTRAAKSDEKNTGHRYFVEEQMVALPLIVMVPALLALIGAGDIMMDLRRGFTLFFESSVTGVGLLTGILYAGLGICGTMIYLDRRENTFCIPLNRCSSLLSGLVASYGLTFAFDQTPPSAPQLAGAALIITAILFLSPLHHFKFYMDEVSNALASIYRVAAAQFENREREPTFWRERKLRQVFLFVCSGNTFRSPIAQAICRAEIAALLNISADDLRKTGIEVLSAGISAKPGAPMKPEAERALTSMSVPVHKHAAESLTARMIEQAGAVYCMTEEQRQTAKALVPEAAAKIHCLDPQGDIEEPEHPEAALSFAVRVQELIRLRIRELMMEPELPG